MKAMIFAAGLGTRLSPLTDSKPKALVEINGKPMLLHQIEKLREAGCTYIVVNVHHFANQIIDFISSRDFGLHVDISNESEMLLNTGGGLKNVKRFFLPGDNFIIHNVDIFSDVDLRDLYNFHCNGSSLATLAVKHRESSKKLLFDTNDLLCGWHDLKNEKHIISCERESYNEMAFSGIYVCNYKIFDLIDNEGAFPIIPELLKIAKNHAISAYIHDQNNVIDVGKIDVIRKIEGGKI